MSKKVIIVTNIFNGRYLNGGNIGHEVINFIKATNGKYYLWINSNGKINSEYKDWKIDVVMVRSTLNNLYKIVGVALDCQVLPGVCDKKENMNSCYNQQATENITYKYEGKLIKLSEVFKNNILNGKSEGENNIFVSLVSEKVYRPKEDMFIKFTSAPDNEKCSDIIHIKNISFERQRGYYKKGSKSYDNLSGIIETIPESNKWKEPDKVNFEELSKKEMSVLEVTKKSHDELAVSNMLAYFLSKYKLLPSFCKNLFNCDMLNSEFQCEIAREKSNIDILIYAGEDIFIIENKIDSFIQVYDEKKKICNHINKSIESSCKQLGLDCAVCQCIIDYIDSKNDNCDKFSQLSKYYIYALLYIYKISHSIDPGKVHCIVLMPDYAAPKKFSIKDVYGGNTLFANEYKLVRYSEVNEFFRENLFSESEDNQYSLISNFKRELEILLSEFDNDIEQIEMIKFANRLKELSEQQKNELT